MNVQRTSHQPVTPKAVKPSAKDLSSAKNQNLDSVKLSPKGHSQQSETEPGFLKRLITSDAVALGTPLAASALGTGAIASLISAEPSAIGVAMFLGFAGVGVLTGGAAFLSLGEGNEAAAVAAGVGGALVGSIGAGFAAVIGAGLGADPSTLGLVTGASLLASPAAIVGLGHLTQAVGLGT